MTLGRNNYRSIIKHIDVIDEFRVEPQKPLGEVCMYGRGVEETHVETCLAYSSALLQVPADQATLAGVWGNHSKNINTYE
jgi:hypothetical protein